jgi:hypothetical protein
MPGSPRGSPLAKRTNTSNERLRFRITVGNRDSHYLSHPEIASDKRIYQQLRAPVESVTGDFVDLPTSAA